jgi:hypothetical protein
MSEYFVRAHATTIDNVIRWVVCPAPDETAQNMYSTGSNFHFKASLRCWVCRAANVYNRRQCMNVYTMVEIPQQRPEICRALLH